MFRFPMMLLVTGLIFLDARSDGHYLGDVGLGAVTGGAYTRCTDRVGVDPAIDIVACNSCVNKVRCTSTDFATRCGVYKNLYGCIECDPDASGIACAGKKRLYSIADCIGPYTEPGNCTRNIKDAVTQQCTGNCP